MTSHDVISEWFLISEWQPSWISGFVQIVKKPSKIASKVITTSENTKKWSKILKKCYKKAFLIFLIREVKMPAKIWLPWKSQVTWTLTCHIFLLPNKFSKKSPSLVAFALIFKKLITCKVAAGRIRPPPSPPPGLNRVKDIFDSTSLPNLTCL